MEIIIASIFTIIITISTVYYLIKLFTLAYKKEEITYFKLMVYVTSVIAVGFIVASILPLMFAIIVDVFS